MDVIRYPFVYRSLADQICLRLHDLCGRKSARIYLCCIPLRHLHPGPISHPHATHHLLTTGMLKRLD
jgi:hypothetical protein